MIYALGFTLEKLAAMQEHGVKGRLFPTYWSLDSPIPDFSLHSRNMGAYTLLYYCALHLSPFQNGFDIAFSMSLPIDSGIDLPTPSFAVAIYIPYATLRLYGYKYHGERIAASVMSRCRRRLAERWAKEAGIDCLALAACLMFPRYVPRTFIGQPLSTYPPLPGSRSSPSRITSSSSHSEPCLPSSRC
jgi:hypothetical protein